MLSHYAGVAGRYSKNVFYGDGVLKEWQLGILVKVIGKVDRIADVGGGNGKFIRSLQSEIGKKCQVTLVEPSREMLKESEIEDCIHAGADDWACSEKRAYDCILLKEVVHHFDDRVQTFSALRQRLFKDGSLVIVTRPKYSIEYPFFPEAKKIWSNEQPDEQAIFNDLQKAGFHDIKMRTERFPLEISKDIWSSMLKNRFWSTFAHFSDDELNDGIKYMNTKYSEKPILHFFEKMICITAVSSSQNRKDMTIPVELSPAVKLAQEGYLSSLELIPRETANTLLDDIESFLQCPAEALNKNDSRRFKLHLLLPRLASVIRSPAILQILETYFGSNNILVWSSDLIAKPPTSTASIFTPHQDAAYAGISPALHGVTAWIALTHAPEVAGCLRVFPQSHLCGHFKHETKTKTNTMLAFNQTIPEFELCTQSAVPLPLSQGECSLHTLPLVHYSDANLSPHRRIGLAVRYVAADVQRTHGGIRESATLVSGQYLPEQGAFDLEPIPQHAAGPSELQAHADAVSREAANYASAPQQHHLT